jgi:hypothetical protein
VPFPTSCTHCGRKLRVPEHLEGRMVGCPGCAKAFEARPSGSLPPPPRPDVYYAAPPTRPPEYDRPAPAERRSSRYDEYDDDRDDQRDRKRRRERKALAMCLPPGIVFIVVAVLNVVVVGLIVVGHLTDLRTGEKDEYTVPSIFIHSASIIASVVILLGGIQMIRLQTWGLGIAASVLCLVPCISPCVIMGIPCGVWGLVVLCNAKVKESFQ